MKQKQYNKKFKQTIVDLHRSDTNVSDLSREYGVSEVTIYKWIKKLSPVDGAENLTTDDISDMQKEHLRLKQEIEILKKAFDSFRKTFV